MTNPDDSAFPTDNNYDGNILAEGGLTKREYFAAMAMQGILSGYNFRESESLPNIDFYGIAVTAATMADEQIKELNAK